MDWATLIQTLLPASMAGSAPVIIAFLVASCALIARFWPRPKDGSKWLLIYTLVNQIGMNGNHAANADDVGRPRG